MNPSHNDNLIANSGLLINEAMQLDAEKWAQSRYYQDYLLFKYDINFSWSCKLQKLGFQGAKLLSVDHS